MEVRNRIIRKTVLWIIPIGVVLLIYACHHAEKEKVFFPPVYVAKHTLMTLSPDFTMEADSMALYKQYLRLRTGKVSYDWCFACRWEIVSFYRR